MRQAEINIAEWLEKHGDPATDELVEKELIEITADRFFKLKRELDDMENNYPKDLIHECYLIRYNEVLEENKKIFLKQDELN